MRLCEKKIVKFLTITPFNGTQRTKKSLTAEMSCKKIYQRNEFHTFHSDTDATDSAARLRFIWMNDQKCRREKCHWHSAHGETCVKSPQMPVHRKLHSVLKHTWTVVRGLCARLAGILLSINSDWLKLHLNVSRSSWWSRTCPLW